MPQPVTTAELLLAQVVDLLTEVRDLLHQAQPNQAEKSSDAAPAKAAKKAPAKRAAKKSTTKS